MYNNRHYNTNMWGIQFNTLMH